MPSLLRRHILFEKRIEWGEREKKRNEKVCDRRGFSKFCFQYYFVEEHYENCLKRDKPKYKKRACLRKYDCYDNRYGAFGRDRSVFAIGGIDGEAWEEICTPVWALHPVILVIFFALALCLLAISLSITFFSPLHLCGKPMQTAYILYACVYALTYIWIPLTYKATAFFASALTCAVCLVLLSVLYPLVRRVGKLPSLCLLLFSAWQGYLLCFSFALFVVN